MRRVRLLVADEYALSASALTKLLSDEVDVVGVALSSSAMLIEVDRLKPDVVLTKITKSSSGFLSAMKTIHNKFATVQLIVLTEGESQRFTDEVLSSGATACVPMTADTSSLLHAIQRSAAGKMKRKRSLRPAAVFSTTVSDGFLSPRQEEILMLLISGRSVKEIAEVLHISPKTVEFHKYRMMRMMGTKTLAELIVAGVRIADRKRQNRESSRE